MTSVAELTSEPSDAPSPSRSDRLSKRRRYHADLLGIAVVCVVMIVGYYQVPFGGKTFSTSAFVTGFAGCATPTGVCPPRAGDDPRADAVASAWFLEPSARVIHRQIAAGDVPLWNPHTAIGSPLAASLQPAVFDPLLLAVFIHPTQFAADLSILLWLLLVGLAAYLAARVLRLLPLPATMVGVVYGLSGWFFAYSNNWFFRAYLFLPLLIAAIEWTIRSRRRLPVALLGIALAGIFVVGMPEPMFMSIVAAGVFGIARLFFGEREGTRGRVMLRLVGSSALGLALAAPLVLGFGEYLPLSHNAHPYTGRLFQVSGVPQLLNWVMPKITNTPMPVPFDTRNWIGAAAVVLVLVAVCHPRTMRRYDGWPLMLVVAVVGLQIYGGPLVAWTGRIPLWSQLAWVTFGAPVLAFPLAMLAGIGIQAVQDDAIDRRRVVVVSGALVVAAAVVVLRDSRDLDLWDHVRILGGWPLALCAVVAVVLAARYLKGHTAATAIAVVVIVELVLLAPRGIYADRGDPYPVKPWISYLQSHTQDHSRVFSDKALLYPNVSSAYDLKDPRILDAVFPDRYWQYLETFVTAELTDRFTADSYEPPPNLVANPMFDLLGVRYFLYPNYRGHGPTPALAKQLRPAFALQRIAIFENLRAAPRAFVVHDLHAVPDLKAAVEYFKAEEPARFPDGAVKVERFDPRRSAVVEADPDIAKPRACAAGATSSADIVSYSASEVKIAVENSCPGLLVLSDQYFPGWSATVDGDRAKIYATDVALRGVPVPAGESTVVFRYRPASFRNGLILLVLGLIALGYLAVGGLRSSRWGRQRRIDGW